MSENKIRVAITHGDINGIGYEVILKTFEDNRLLELCTPVLYGSGKIAGFYRKALELTPVQFHTLAEGEEPRNDAFNLVNVVGEELKIEPGTESKIAGQAAFMALEKAMDDLLAGRVDVLVTAPINKHSIQSDEFSFPGHTEYLQAKAGNESSALMILASDKLRVALATTHLPVGEVASALTVDGIYNKLVALNHSLIEDFGIVRPRIAVLGLNPHAGDEGVLGKEETTIIAPAIEKANQRRILAFGPYAADGFFGSRAYEKFDAVLAMYHDQGLVAFKTISMGSGVNFTAGLPFVRTSPDHGTAFDIAGKGEADPTSMREAIYMACDIFRNRLNHGERTANPLKKQYFDKSKDNVVLDLSSDE